MKKSTLSVLLGLFAIIGTTIPAQQVFAQDEVLGKCLYTQRLYEDQIEMDLFTQLVARVKATGASSPITSDNLIDSESINCLGCHDGSIGSSPAVTVGRSATNLQDSHKIGTHYKRATWNKKDLHNVNLLPKDVLLVEGKVGCLSCHNPLNKQKSHLSVESQNSNLCFSCHNK